MNCISILENLKKQNDVKEIMKSIERCKKFELPKSCRQRRTMNVDGTNDVSEAYSPPRITKMARAMGLHAGWALDLIETDPDDNKPWDFSQEDKRKKALHKVKVDKPFMLVVSPM